MSIFQTAKDLINTFIGQPKSMKQSIIDKVRQEDFEVQSKEREMTKEEKVQKVLNTFLDQPRSVQQRVIDQIRQEDPQVADEIERFRDMKQRNKKAKEKIDRLIQKI